MVVIVNKNLCAIIYCLYLPHYNGRNRLRAMKICANMQIAADTQDTNKKKNVKQEFML